MSTYYTRKEWRVQIAVGRARPGGARRLSLTAISNLFAFLFVMFERRVQTAYHFRGGFEERLRFGFIDFVSVAAQMFDEFPEFIPNIRSMRSRIF
jgi:hypothetical protein